MPAPTSTGADNPGYPVTLIAAVLTGDPEVVRILVEAGADPRTETGRVPIPSKDFRSAEDGEQWEIVRILLDGGADPNAYDSETGMPLLGRAIASRDAEAVQLLVDAGADPNLEPLVFLRAVEAGDPKIVEILLDAGADLNVAIFDVTPLIMAIETGQSEIVALLIDAGADVNANAGNDWGVTPLEVATDAGDEEIVDILVAAGAEQSKETVAERPSQDQPRVSIPHGIRRFPLRRGNSPRSRPTNTVNIYNSSSKRAYFQVVSQSTFRARFTPSWSTPPMWTPSGSL